MRMGAWERDRVRLSSVRAYGSLGTGSRSIEFCTCVMGTGSCSIEFYTCVMGTWEPDHVRLTLYLGNGNLGTGSRWNDSTLA